MLDDIRELQTFSKTLIERLRANGKSHKSPKLRAEAQTLVDIYFRHARGKLLTAGFDVGLLANSDALMQGLLECTHRESGRDRYLSSLSSIRDELIALEKRALLNPTVEYEPSFEPIDLKILDPLRRLSSAAASCYEQALLDLKPLVRFSWRGPATDLREALRETLDTMAPEAQVKAQPNFKLEENTKAPTMRQKVRFALKKNDRDGSTEAPERAAEAVEDAVGNFARSVYSRSSKSTHTSTERDEVLRIREYVRVVLCELLGVH